MYNKFKGHLLKVVILFYLCVEQIYELLMYLFVTQCTLYLKSNNTKKKINLKDQYRHLLISITCCFLFLTSYTLRKFSQYLNFPCMHNISIQGPSSLFMLWVLTFLIHCICYDYILVLVSICYCLGSVFPFVFPSF